MLASRGNAVALRTLIVQLVPDNVQSKAWFSTYIHVYYCTWSNIGNAIKLLAILYCLVHCPVTDAQADGWVGRVGRKLRLDLAWVCDRCLDALI